MHNILDEYKELLEKKIFIEAELEKLPKGYISKKTISGKQYSYLQIKTGGKLTGEYLKNEEVEHISGQLALRKEYETELPKIAARLEELEKAAQLIGNGIDRTLMLFKISVGMDDMETVKKSRCISFANAMNAIEGVPVSRQTADEVALWKDGMKSYMAVFAATLRRYGFAVEE